MNPDAVLSSVASRLGVNKADMIDPTSTDAAIKQAHAETHVIAETKAYFLSEGVNLEALRSNTRGDTAILIKNLPYSTQPDRLRQLFERHGQLSRFLYPPSGTIAIAEFSQADQASDAFSALAYRRFGDSVLFLEKAPVDLFRSPAGNEKHKGTKEAMKAPQHRSATDLFAAEPELKDAEIASVYIKNLNFTTTTEKLVETFRPLDGFVSGRVKTKPDPKNPGSTLSMGFGFLEFKTAADAEVAIAAMDGSSLDGHSLQLKKSRKIITEGRDQDSKHALGKRANNRTKIIIKNLPFEASREDLRKLLGPYGKLRSVRVPKKFDQGSRGFGFAEFISSREAENAMTMLENTHLLGRRLILEFARAEAQDAEEAIQEMIGKVGKQVAKVNVARLAGRERKKFRADDEEDEG